MRNPFKWLNKSRTILTVFVLIAITLFVFAQFQHLKAQSKFLILVFSLSLSLLVSLFFLIRNAYQKSYFKKLYDSEVERMETEKMLVESQKSYQKMIETINDAFYEVTIEGIITYISPVIEKILGYKPNEVIGKNFLTYVYESDRGLIAQKLSKHESYDGSILEYRYYTKSGGICWVRSSNTPVIENGKIVAEKGILTNITKQKQTEIDLLKSETIYRTILNASPDAIVITDLEDNILLVSPRTTQIFGYKNIDAFVNHKLLGFIDENYHDKVKNMIVQALQGNYSGVSEFKGIKSDGTSFYLDVNCDFIKDENGQPFRLVYTARDTTEKKHAENKLIESERKLREAQEMAHLGYWQWDIKTGKVEWSYEIYKIFGLNPEEFSPQVDSILALSPWPKDNQRDHELLNWAIESRTAGCYEQRFLRPDKSIGYYFSSFQGNYDENGNVISIVGTLLDITKSKQVEEVLINEQSLLKTLIDNLPVGVFVKDKEYKKTIVNRLHSKELAGHLKHLGMNSEMDFLEKTDFEVFPKEMADAFFIEDQKVIRDGAIILNREGESYSEDGKKLWMLLSKIPFRNNNNEIIGMIGVATDITERKKAEEELAKEKYLMDTLMENVPGKIYFKDMTSRFIRISKLQANLFELNDPAQAIGKTDSDFYSAEHALQAYNDEQDVIRTGQPIKIEEKETWNDRPDTWVSTIKLPMRNKEGKIIGTFGISVDITERKLAEEDIKQKNERLSAIVKAMPDLIFIVDKDGTYLEYYTNDPNKMLLHKNDIVGLNIKSIFDEYTGNLHMKKINECLQLQKLITYEYSIIINNKTFYFEARVVPLTNNKVLRFIRDFTEKKTQDEEINKLLLAVEQSPVLIVITDLNGNVEYVNPAFELTTGYTRKEVIGKSTRILKSGTADKLFYKDMWDTLIMGDEWRGELINKKKNGELYWESMSITPVRNSSGKITNYLAIKQDISLRKQAEQEIHKLNTNLELKIEERTSELKKSNETLVQEIEKRRAIEEALLIKSTELENFFNVTSDLLSITNKSGILLKVNKAWSNILGYSATELEGTPFQRFIHPDDMSSALVAINSIDEQNPIVEFVNRYKTIDGNYRYIEWHSVSDGFLNYSAARDITERKRIEDFEFELLQLSSKITGISTNEIDDAIKMSLESIGRFLTVDRVYIFEINMDQKSMFNTYEWYNEGISSGIDFYQNFPFDFIPEWMAAITKHEIINIPSVEDLPASWKAERDILQRRKVKSSIAIPMLFENNLIGFVGLDDISKNREFNKGEINLLKVWGSMLSSLINREKTEKLLEQTRQNYEIFFNTLDDFIWVIDKKGDIIHFNSTVLNRLEYSFEELVGQSLLIVYPPDRQKEVKNILEKVLLGDSEKFSEPLISKSGKIISSETKTIQGFWNGQPIIFGISKDISQLELSEQKFSTAFQANSAMMAISNFDDGKYVDVNNSFLEVLGYTRNEIIGKTNKELQIFVDQHIRDEILDSLDKGISVRKIEIIMRSKDGILKTGLMSADSITIGDKRCLLTVNIDITERKKVEEELNAAQLEANRANQAKSEFLSRMSHELRTPMNSILGFAQLLGMDELNPEQTKDVEHIIRSGKHLLDLINEVLDISRIETGQLSISIEPVKILSIIQEVIDIVRPLADQRQISIKLIELPDNLVYVKTDKQRLKQVILNLINNAIKYNKESGTITIKIELMPKLETGITPVRVSISDTGIGISKENLKKLFKPFERIGAEKTQIEGSGLGLAVVKKIIDALGGNIGVESELNKGSTFWVEVPMIESQLENYEITADLLGANTFLLKSKGTLLYIENNTSNIELVDKILKSLSPDVSLFTCLNGKDGIDFACEYAPDLILLDLNLPDIHGGEVLKKLLSDEKTKNIPVIIISADAMPHQHDKLIKAGAKKCLTKPIDIVEFLKVVSEYLV